MYDFSIIGAGVAGLKLALEMSKDPFFTQKKILIIEKSNLEINDKRWCFWEKGTGKYENIIHYQWNKGRFVKKNNTEIILELKTYHYKMVLALDFYNHAKKTLLENKNITWITDEVVNLEENIENVSIICKNNNFISKLCFDSRISPEYHLDKKYIKVFQHFKGIIIKFEEEVFDPKQFTMMDFTASFDNKTSFMYILPTSKNEALVEFTLFTSEILEEKIYDQYINKYIKEKISEQPFSIIETEKGVIPMTTFPFHKTHTSKILKIGTAGGWVRPSTGYSFKKSDFYVEQIIKNIKNNQKLTKNLFNPKTYLFDTILLSILKNENEKGSIIFTQMYQNISVKLIFEFLDGVTTINKDLRVMLSFNPFPFLNAIWREFILKRF